MAHKLSAEGAKLIQSFEGLQLTAYKPNSAETNWTIGYGHSGSDVKQGMTISQAKADELFAKDVQKFVDYVNNSKYVPVTNMLTQNEFDALVLFAYNCGAGNLQTLCKGRTKVQIADHIQLYNKGADGSVMGGLVKRRKAEYDLFTRSEPEMTVEDANEIIKYLGAAWGAAKTQAEKDKIHRLANAARKASGQKEQ